MYISTSEELQAFVKTIAGTAVLAIDTEFHREKTYYPKLCLLQLATEETSAIVDPLTIADLSPINAILTAPETVKVFHAGSQDIEILCRVCGVAPHPVFDTQIAAGLLGHPQQLGYGALVNALCGVNLAKADSLTDWTRRPLREMQLEYAINDVLYLPRMYRSMVKDLTRLGRLGWLQDDFEHLCDPETYATLPEEQWRRVKRVSSLTRRQLAVARGVAAWREHYAQNRNIPRKWVLSDEVIIEIARLAPTTKERLLDVRGLSERLSDRAVREILDATADELAGDPEGWPKLEHHRGKKSEVDGAVDLMLALLHLRAKENDVTTQFLASRDDLVKIAKGEGEGLDVLSGWRRRLIGAELLELLDGKLCLSIEDGKLKVTKTIQEG